MHARPTRLRARRTTSAVAASAAAAVLLSACGGEPGAQETVGPTAGAPSPTSEQSYAPTLPPYTSDVELTDEEEQDVEELLLLIDEFNILTSTLTEEGIEEARTLEGTVEKELLDWHLSDMESSFEEGIRTRGVVLPQAATVLSYNGNESTVSICYSFDDYLIFNESDPDTPIHTNRPTEYSFETDAIQDGEQWIVSDRRDSRISCDEH